MKKLPFLAAGLLLTLHLHAQSHLLDKKVSLSCYQLSLSAICEQLQRDYHIPFSYFNQPTALQKSVSLQVKDKPLKVVLEQLLAGTNIQYQVIGDQIALKEIGKALFVGLKGKVIDKLTRVPLVAASVTVVGTNLSTVTNAAGLFSISFPEPYREIRTAVSYVGYQTYTIPSTQVLTGEVLVELESQSQLLDELVVEEKGRFSLLSKTIADMLENYGIDTIQMMNELPSYANGFVIRGKVLDKDTQKPVLFCKILLPDHQTKVSADFNGTFQLTLPATYQQDTLLFSSLIYQELKVPIAALRETASTVLLQKRSNQTETVIAKLRDTRILADRGIANISGNYAIAPRLLWGHYRETMKVSGTDAYFVNMEALLEIYKPPYRERDLKSDQVSIIDGSQQKLSMAFNYDGRLYQLPSWLPNCLYTIDGLDIVKGYSNSFNFQSFASKYGLYSERGIDYSFNPDSFLSIKKTKVYQFELLDLITLHGEQVFVLAFEPVSFWKVNTYFQGRLFVDVKTLAFIRVEYQLNPGGVLSYGPLESTPVKLKRRNYVVNYAKHQDRWNLHKASMESEYWYEGTNVFITSKVDLDITPRETGFVEPLNKQETIRDPYKTFTEQIKVNE